jgi:HAD superfamily hydrolase (TIGR01549 family)
MKKQKIVNKNDAENKKANKAKNTNKKKQDIEDGIKGIIFDIDGVLVDSRYAVFYNTKTLFKEFGFDIEDERIKNMSSAHSAETVLIELAPKLKKNKDLLSKMLARLSEITRENLDLVLPTKLVEHIPKFAKKYSLGIATNRKKSAEMILKKFRIRKYFSAVFTSNDAKPKPNPEMVSLCVKKMGLKPENVIFIGDNLEDMAAGKGARVKTLMLNGTNKKECEQLISRFLD